VGTGFPKKIMLKQQEPFKAQTDAIDAFPADAGRPI
jgi:hypothetical protein